MRASRSGNLAARAVRDPGIAGLALVAAVATVLCLSPAGGVPERVVGFWLSQTVLDLLLFLVCRDIFRSPELPAHMRRFWWALGYSGLLYMIGDGVQAILALRRPEVSAAVPGTVQTLCSIAAMCLVIWSMLTYPLAAATRRERARFWLDAATVLVATAVFAWITTVTPAVLDRGAEVLLGSLLGNGLLVAAAFGGRPDRRDGDQRDRGQPPGDGLRRQRRPAGTAGPHPERPGPTGEAVPLAARLRE